MSHPNALLRPRGRLQRNVSLISAGALRQAAERFQVSAPTAARWAKRYREHGPAGMDDPLQPAAFLAPAHGNPDGAADHRPA